MKDFNDFINYFNLDCQHLAVEAAVELANNIKAELDANSISPEIVNAIASISADTTMCYLMLMPRCYHQWLNDSES